MRAVVDALGQFLDHAGGRHVLGEVEIVDAGEAGGLGDMAGEVEGRGAQHGVMALEGRLQRHRIGEIELDRLDARRGDGLQGRGRIIRHRDGVIAAVVEHVGDGGADLAGADDED